MDAYEQSGVSIERANKGVELIKETVKSTLNENVLSGIGGFGALYQLKDYKNPVLVSGTDGVGSKLLLSIEAQNYDNVGIDLVAMCVNDVLCQGAKPLFFLDYLALGYNDPEVVNKLVASVAKGCQISNCALVGGETAELPDLYKKEDFDMAGFVVGVVEKENLIDNSKIKVGNKIIGLKSSGVHSNGFALVRKILFKDNNYKLNDYVEELGMILSEELLKPTKIYVPLLDKIFEKTSVNGLAHITGGGLKENLARIIDSTMSIKIYKDKLLVNPIFKLLQEKGNISDADMFKTFNMGVGMCLVVEDKEVDKILEIVGEDGYVVGEVTNYENSSVCIG